MILKLYFLVELKSVTIKLYLYYLRPFSRFSKSWTQRIKSAVCSLIYLSHKIPLVIKEGTFIFKFKIRIVAATRNENPGHKPLRAALQYTKDKSNLILNQWFSFI